MENLARLLKVFAVGGALVACIGTSPQEKEPAVQGDYDDGDEEHRPGQPCLLCHGEGHLITPPGKAKFAIAGTIYAFIDDNEDNGVEDVIVTITDADGDEFPVTSNRTGNFMFDVNTGQNEQGSSRGGRTTIPKQPRYPLSVSVRLGTTEQEMKTKIWREGSCAHCHGPRPSADSVGRVYLFEGDEQ